ncbi:hypothetical protein BSK54_10325 [Paenibacillus odorifer]|uniref:stalk domain-containing protein n=1 Tax=Paenibacillus odorifer TaxID=189426 RepID=UPI00096F9A86|nr:stalk domain-containing protein [Paenibacillus odorifer]OME02645.1 hypothetical protein BSK54_10325 [Paenibacillus odorifer]
MKKAIIGLVAGMLIGSAGMAAAATTQTVQAVLKKLSISVNGQKQEFKNDPLVYKGVTYLPLREISEILGYGLVYDGNTIDFQNKDVNILKSNPISEVSSIKLKDTSEKIYSIGEVIETENFKVKVNGITYTTSHGGFIAESGEVFAVVNFDVFTDKDPSYKVIWSATDFLDIFTLDGGKELMGSSFTVDKVKLNQWTTVNVSKSIPEGYKISNVKFSDPVLRNLTYYKVSLTD